MRFLSTMFLLAITVCANAAPPQTDISNAQKSAATKPSGEPSNQEINDRYVQQITERIASRKDDPAAQVFKNIQIEWLKSVPASRFLIIMNHGYSRALGVSCTHCHIEQDFASDQKRPKRAAREMAVMHRAINDQLRQMQNLKSPPEDRLINCFTCHRGAINPNEEE